MDDRATKGRPSDDASAARLLLDEIRAGYRGQKAHAEDALAQLEPDDWTWRPDPESNSIAILVRHLAGNMRSRWRDVPLTDGEKPDRDRDGEFEPPVDDPEALRAEWEDGWRTTFDAIDRLRPEDLGRVATIRGQPHTVARALLGQLTHYAEHVGQIVLLAKHRRGAAWRTLSIPKTRR